MLTPPSAGARYRALQAVVAAGLPLAVIACFIAVQSRNSSALDTRASVRPPPLRSTPATSRLVVVAVDGLAGVRARDVETMPTLSALAEDSLHGPLEGCVAALPLPCLLTALEGRQSAYHATIDAFSSEPRENLGWPRAARGEGLRIEAIAAGPLPRLYPGAWSRTVSGDALPPLVDAAVVALRKRDADALLVHLPHHTEAPAVDTAVGRIHSELTADDTLIVFGTYGLDGAGRPARNTWYLATGPRLIRARIALDQVSIAYLLARLSGSPLPENYGGSLRWELVSDVGERAWRAQLADAWERPQIDRRHLALALERRQQTLQTRPARDVGAFIPWLLHILLIGGAIASSFAGDTTLRQSWLAWQVAWLSASFVWPDEAPWLALFVQVWISWPRAGGWGGVPALVLWGVLAFGSGVAMPLTYTTFGAEYAGPTSVLIWYFLVGGIPLLIGAFAMSRLGARSRWSRAALVALGSVAILPPPGWSYFSAAQGVTRALYPLVGFVVLSEARPRSLIRWLQLLVLLSASSFGVVDVAPNGWVSRPLLWLGALPEPAQIGVACGCLGLVLPVWWVRRGPSKTALGASTFVLFVAASHITFGMPWDKLAALAWLHLALAMGLDLLRSPTALSTDPEQASSTLLVDIGPDERQPGVTIKTAWQVALTLSTAFVALWVATDGPYLTHVELDTLVNHFSARFESQWLVAVAALGWSALGWSLVIGMAPLTLLTTLRSERLVALGRWILLLVSFKVLAQGMQLLGVRLVQTIQWSELLLQESAAVALLALLLWTALIIVALYRHGAQWLMGRDRVY